MLSVLRPENYFSRVSRREKSRAKPGNSARRANEWAVNLNLLRGPSHPTGIYTTFGRGSRHQVVFLNLSDSPKLDVDRGRTSDHKDVGGFSGRILAGMATSKFDRTCQIAFYC